MDFETRTVIIGKKQRERTAKSKAEVNEALRRGGHSEKKITAGPNKAPGTDHQRIAKIDRENEVAPPARVAPSVGKAMMEARAAKGLTQKDLAQKINEKPTVIQEYESGKAIPKDAVLAKLERVLEVKFRGTGIGDKIEKKSKS